MEKFIRVKCLFQIKTQTDEILKEFNIAPATQQYEVNHLVFSASEVSSFYPHTSEYTMLYLKNGTTALLDYKFEEFCELIHGTVGAIIHAD